MMKKTIFTSISIMIAFIAHSAFAEEAKDPKVITAHKINLFGIYHKVDLQEGIASTLEINGTDVWHWISNYAKMNTEGVSTVKRSENGEFSSNKDLSTFDQSALSLAHYDYRRRRYHGSNQENISQYTGRDWSLIQSLNEGSCVLCGYGDKQVIIINSDPQNTPKKTCEEFKPIHEQRCKKDDTLKKDIIQKQAKANARMTSKAYYAQKKAQKLAAV